MEHSPDAADSPAGRALIVLDLTRDRVDAGGAWPVAELAPISRYIEGEIAYFRERQRPVIHVTSRYGSANEAQDAGCPPHNIDGSPGAAIAAAFRPRDGELLIEKKADSAFLGTTLSDRLLDLGVRSLTLVGVETHTTVLATALDAVVRGFKVVVPDTCVTSSDPTLHGMALRVIREARWRRIPR